MKIGFGIALPLICLGMAVAASSLVNEVRAAMDSNRMDAAEATVAQHRSREGDTPENLEALSWLGRGSLARKQYDKAIAFADQTHAAALKQLAKHPIDSDPHMELAIGAAVEVRAQAMSAQGERAEAVAYLREQSAKYGKTKIAPRIHKNLNLLTLEGKPAPEIDAAEHLGPKPPSLASLRGKPVLVFFWAHWCPDCKREVPVVARLLQEHGKQGLTLIAPTQRYGYVAGGEEATPARELAYIEEVRKRSYSALGEMPAPVSLANSAHYGTSTMPTLVLVDRQGVVRLYHPGAMSYEDLRAAVAKVL